MSTTGYAFNVFVDSATSDSGVPKTQQPAIFPSGVDWKQAYRWEWNIADSGSPNSWFAVGNRLLTVPSAIPGGTKGNLPGNILSLTLLDINTQGSGPDFLEVSQLAVWVVVVHVSINGNHTSNLFNAAVTTDGFTQTGVVTVPNLTFANNVTNGTITVTVDATNAPLTTSDLRVLPQY